MKLRELAGRDFPEIDDILSGPAGVIDVAGVTSDSRKASPGTLFFALSGGKADGASFLADAAARGAVAAVAGAPVEADIPVLVVSDPRRFLALAAARFFRAQP